VEIVRVKLTPQRNDNILEYQYKTDKVVVIYHKREVRTVLKEIEESPVQLEELQTIETFTDTFDFLELPDGIVTDIETNLPVNPIVSAERKDGLLSIVLLNFIGADATVEDRFPIWKEV
jgi:hypothetical protein